MDTFQNCRQKGKGRLTTRSLRRPASSGCRRSVLDLLLHIENAAEAEDRMRREFPSPLLALMYTREHRTGVSLSLSLHFSPTFPVPYIQYPGLENPESSREMRWVPLRTTCPNRNAAHTLSTLSHSLRVRSFFSGGYSFSSFLFGARASADFCNKKRSTL